MGAKFADIDEKTRARFWEKVDVRGPDDCWEWTARRNDRGYGRFSVGTGKLNASRVQVMMVEGRDLRPDELACHRCDNPPCVNPKHLFVGSPGDNIRDARSKGRLRRDGGPYNRGETNPNAKLTDSAVREIRRLAITHDHGELSAMFGVAVATINAIVHRYTWKNV